MVASVIVFGRMRVSVSDANSVGTRFYFCVFVTK
jgi:hypothetical protein